MTFFKRILTSTYLNLRYLKTGEIFEKVLDSGKSLYWNRLQLDYQAWLKRFNVMPTKNPEFKNQKSDDDVVFHFLIFVESGTPSTFQRTVKSLKSQLSPESSITLIGPATRCEEYFQSVPANVRSRMTASSSLPNWLNTRPKNRPANTYFVTLTTLDQLNPYATAFWAQQIRDNYTTKFLYSDSDCVDINDHHHSPHFKPGWNYELYLHSGYIGPVGVIHHSILPDFTTDQDECSQIMDLHLRSLEQLKPSEICHVPKILVHNQGAETRSTAALAKIVSDHFQRKGIIATVEGTANSSLRINYPVPANAKASLIIPTRNRSDLLKTCIDSILKKTTFKNFEIIVVDNGSDEPETLAYLSDLKKNGTAQVIRDDSPFNYSALNNMAAGKCDGDFLVFVNNDIEVISPNWLTDLIANANRSDVGAVGARLWYPDGSIQHAGIILGLNGVAGHGHLGLAKSDSGYHNRAVLPQFYSAVTGACLCVQRHKFELVGGFNENQLTVGFNDVDLCLRLMKANLENLWLPQVELYHHESVSRGQDLGLAKHTRSFLEILYIKRTHADLIKSDPYYNPNLAIRGKSFDLAIPPRR
jgi:GT2 family glycosyltransferase